MMRELSDIHRSSDADALTEAEIELLSRHLPRYTAAEPTLRESRALADRIRPLLRDNARIRASEDEAAASARPASPARFADRLREAEDARQSAFGAIIRYAAAHARSFSWMFWAVSALAVLLGVIVHIGIAPAAMYGILEGTELRTNVLIVLVPFIAGLSLSWSFRSFGTPMFELELSFPMTPLQWLLGRLSIIVFYQAGLAMAASFVLTRGWLDESLPVLVISWLAPLGLYCAGTLALTIRFGPLYGTLIMASLWIAQLPLQQHLGPLYFVSDTHHPWWAESKIAALLAALLLAADAIREIRRQRAGRTSLLRGTEG